MDTKKCKSCGIEFLPTRKNQVNCKGSCPKEQKLLYKGGVYISNGQLTVSGALNCYMFMSRIF